MIWTVSIVLKIWMVWVVELVMIMVVVTKKISYFLDLKLSVVALAVVQECVFSVFLEWVEVQDHILPN